MDPLLPRRPAVLTLNVPWNDPELPGVSWLGSPAKRPARKAESGFVLSAAYSNIPGLADLFTAILLNHIIYIPFNQKPSIKHHRTALSRLPQFAHVCRFSLSETSDAYPWRSRGQPLTMYAALTGCVLTLVVADGAALWNGFHKTAFLSAHLAVLPPPSSQTPPSAKWR